MRYLAALLLLAGCGDYPKDIEGTADRIAAAHSFRVGLVGDRTPEAAARFIAEVAARTGARPQLIAGSAEPLLARLEAGQLDLVIGEFAKDSPWITDVAILEPLAQRKVGGRDMLLAPVARNGENRWIMLLESVARDAAKP